MVADSHNWWPSPRSRTVKRTATGLHRLPRTEVAGDTYHPCCPFLRMFYVCGHVPVHRAGCKHPIGNLQRGLALASRLLEALLLDVGRHHRAKVFVMHQQTASLPSSAHPASHVGVRSETLRAAIAAALLGLAIVWTVGFAPLSAIHNAAHDTSHSAGFPCH